MSPLLWVAFLTLPLWAKDYAVSTIPSLPTALTPSAAFATLPSGAQIVTLPAGAQTAFVAVDLATQGLMRELPEGQRVTIWGSQAVDMLNFDGRVAKTGRMNPQGDLDLIRDKGEQAPNKSWLNAVENAYKNDVAHSGKLSHVQVVGPDTAAKFADGWSYGRLGITFTSLGDGRYRADWATQLGTPAQTLAAYADFKNRTLRYQRPTIDLQQASHGLLLNARYQGTSFEPETEARMKATLSTWSRHGDLYQFAVDRLAKAYRHAVDPQALTRLLRSWGVLKDQLALDSATASIKAARR